MKAFFKILDEKILFPFRIDQLTKILIPYLKGNKSVLDLGCSDGRLAKSIQKRCKIKFIGVDKYIQQKTFIPVKKYDGKKLPFKDNSFDCVMLIDVLHHDKNPEKIIKEVRRVAKKCILIKDHYYNNKIDFLLLKFADYIGNKPYNIELCYNFLNMGEWYNLFKKNNLTIIKQKKFCYLPFEPFKHIIFKLKK